jgi:glycosyltransferase involved in cell wall biosynthesis
MTKILAFSFFPAFVPPTNGGQSRLFNFYKALGERLEITLLTSTHVGVEEEAVIHSAGFIERRIPKDQYFTDQWLTLSQYSGGGDLSGPCIAACGKFPTLLTQAYLEEYEKADVIIHDSPFTVHYDIFAGCDDKPRVYNSHNCETQLYGKLHEGAKSWQIRELVRHAELRLLEISNLVFYCSQEDLAYFRLMAPSAQFEAVSVPHGMTAVVRSRSNYDPEQVPFSAVFIGSSHPPNAQAAEFIVRILAPRLPEVTFDIIGSCLSKGKFPPNVRRHGVVSDELKSRLLDQANLALNPMESGSGSNVKVLDYLSYGLPILSTSFGMRGIQAVAGKEYLQASLEHFPEAIRDVVENYDFLSTVAAAGKALAFERYTWDAIAKSAAESIEKLTKAKAERPAQRFVLALNDYDSFSGVGGGATRTRGLYAAVSEWCPVVFVSFSASGNLQARKQSEDITVINVPMGPDHLAELQRVNSQSHVSADDIIASRHCLSNPYLIIVYRVLRHFARCIVLEHCYMAGLPRAWGDRFVYSSQNNETELKKRLLEWHPLKAKLVQDVEDLERFVVECSAATIAVSREDAESLVRGKRTSGPVIIVPNGATTPRSGVTVARLQEALREKIKQRSVVFLGTAHMPNVDAAKFIVEQIAPQCEDVRFHLIGSVCSAIHSVPANVCLWGVVDDVTKSAVMQTCSLGINPMLSGSGSNVKVADYLGNGLYVITSEYGIRGYLNSILEHVEVVALEQFPVAIRAVLGRTEYFLPDARKERRDFFNRELTMEDLAKRFVTTLQSLEVKKKRILYVAYRYISPPQGGAEVNIEKFVSALGHSGQFDVDVVAPEISRMRNHMRFSEVYSFDPECITPVDIPNVRFARFPADEPEKALIDKCLRSAWRVQSRFERAVSRQLAKSYEAFGLGWGWGYPNVDGGGASRWAFAECGIFLPAPAQITLEGYTPTSVVITAQSQGMFLRGSWAVKGNFQIDFQAMAGEIEFSTSTTMQINDPRPLGFLVTTLVVAGKPIDLATSTLAERHLQGVEAGTTFQILDQAATESRAAHNVRLTDGRGPWSLSLERFIIDHVTEYDLIITHNNVFRPAVVAIEEAKKNGVPSILIPHAHLDDDFYHFPDLLESVQKAGLVLAAPKVAVNFFSSRGSNAAYLPAGCDTQENFSEIDVESFRQLYSSNRPFVLVLGRKAGAKGYLKIINAVEQLNRVGIDLQVVLIGPDDDGILLDSPTTSYFGRQPRSVVRGALLSCIALCNMSMSESFGIVLLEAWLARKPVIVNKSCAAFHDMAIDRVNALMVDESELPEAIRELFLDPELSAKLAENGSSIVKQYDWASVSERFLTFCVELSSQKLP